MTFENMVDRFPAFLEISDETLRTQSLKAMNMAMEQGGWDEYNIALCPVTINWKNCDISWIEHMNDITAICIAQFDGLEKYYLRHRVSFSRDLVIAGALMHDIGKLTEFSELDGTVGHRRKTMS